MDWLGTMLGVDGRGGASPGMVRKARSMVRLGSEHGAMWQRKARMGRAPLGWAGSGKVGLGTGHGTEVLAKAGRGQARHGDLGKS